MEQHDINKLLRKYGWEVKDYVGRIIIKDRIFWAHIGGRTNEELMVVIREQPLDGKLYYNLEELEKQLIEISNE